MTTISMAKSPLAYYLLDALTKSDLLAVGITWEETAPDEDSGDQRILLHVPDDKARFFTNFRFRKEKS